MKTATTYQAAGKEVLNYVTAYHPSSGSSFAVRPDGKSIWVDDSKPITLERMREVYDFCCKAAGETLGSIQINMAAYEPGDYDGANPRLWRKTYQFDPKLNSLLIIEDGIPIYANDDGIVCTDTDALYDSLS